MPYAPNLKFVGYALFLMTAGGCAAFHNTGIHLYPVAGKAGEQEFKLVIGYDTLKQLNGLDEREWNIVQPLLDEELRKISYCQDGYVLDYRTWSQGGGYLIYQGHCESDAVSRRRKPEPPPLKRCTSC